MTSIVTIDFHGSVLFAIERDGEVFVALKPIVTGLGMNWSGQEQRLKRDAILAEGICVMHIPSPSGSTQDTLCLRLDLVNDWLFTIDERRVKEDAREKVLTYKRECYATASSTTTLSCSPRDPAAVAASRSLALIFVRLLKLTESAFISSGSSSKNNAVG